MKRGFLEDALTFFANGQAEAILYAEAVSTVHLQVLRYSSSKTRYRGGRVQLLFKNLKCNTLAVWVGEWVHAHPHVFVSLIFAMYYVCSVCVGVGVGEC